MADKKEPLHMVNFRMTPSEIERLDQIATYCGISRAQLLYNMVTASMDEWAVFKKIGVVQTVLTVRDILDVLGKRDNGTLQNLDKDDPLKA